MLMYRKHIYSLVERVSTPSCVVVCPRAGRSPGTRKVYIEWWRSLADSDVSSQDCSHVTIFTPIVISCVTLGCLDPCRALYNMLTMSKIHLSIVLRCSRVLSKQKWFICCVCRKVGEIFEGQKKTDWVERVAQWYSVYIECYIYLCVLWRVLVFRIMERGISI